MSRLISEPPNLAEVLARARNGDRAALDEAFSAVRPGLERWIAFRFGEFLRTRLDVEDIVQEALSGASAGLERFTYETPGAFAAWLMQIAENRIRDAGKHFTRERRDARREQELKETLRVSWCSASGEVQRNEERERLLAMIATLSPSHREIIRLIRFDGMTYADAAKVLSITEKAAGARLTRALLTLKRLLDDPTAKTVWGSGDD